jgi:hypothetical protein
VNARTVNNVHLAFLIAYLGVTGAAAKSIAAWPAQMGPRSSAADGVIETLLARHPLVIWLGLPCAVLALHVVTRLGQQLAPAWWLFARNERYLLDLASSESALICEDRRLLFAWTGWFATFATVCTSGLMYALGSLAITGDPEPLRMIPRLVGPILGLSLVAFTLAVRYGIRARKRIKALVLASSAAVDGRHRDALDPI